MKTFVLFLALVGVAVLISTPAAGSKTLVGKKQKATVQFNDPVLLQGVTLKGEYLFLHDDSAMTRGEACTRVYKGDSEIPAKLVVAFHCVPLERAKAAYFAVRTNQFAPGVNEVTEYQFKGDSEAHGVPKAPATAHVHMAF
jgi:hypothetical protein